MTHTTTPAPPDLDVRTPLGDALIVDPETGETHALRDAPQHVRACVLGHLADLLAADTRERDLAQELADAAEDAKRARAHLRAYLLTDHALPVAPGLAVERRTTKRPNRRVNGTAVLQYQERLPASVRPTKVECQACSGTGKVDQIPGVAKLDKARDEIVAAGLPFAVIVEAPEPHGPDPITVIRIGAPE